MSRRNVYYNVRPRYTPGSPAQVNETTARQCAAQELRAHRVTMHGIYGTYYAEEAAKDTLRGIAERVEEFSDCWIVDDLLTHERYIRPFVQPTQHYTSAAQCEQLTKREFVKHARLKSKHNLPLECELPDGPAKP